MKGVIIDINKIIYSSTAFLINLCIISLRIIKRFEILISAGGMRRDIEVMVGMMVVEVVVVVVMKVLVAVIIVIAVVVVVVAVFVMWRL